MVQLLTEEFITFGIIIYSSAHKRFHCLQIIVFIRDISKSGEQFFLSENVVIRLGLQTEY